MESLLRSDVPDIVSHFDLALQDLTDLTASSNSSVKAKANKVGLIVHLILRYIVGCYPCFLSGILPSGPDLRVSSDTLDCFLF